MDTSEQYIKMCEKAEEIQGVAKRGDDWHPHDYWYFPAGSKNEYGYSSEAEIAVIGDAEDCGHCLSYYCDQLPDAIWLPRQDQLQEMIYPHEGRDYSPLFELDSWHEKIFRNKKYFDGFASYEQIWLAYVMFEKYGKVWNGGTWS